MADPGPEQKPQDIAQALEKSEARFRRVVEYSPSAMVMVRADGLIEMVNAQAERMFGYPREELLGLPVEVLVPERFRHGHPGHRRSFFSRPQSRPMGAGRDLYGLRRDGTEFPVEIGLNPIETEDGTMVLSAIVDISDRKSREERIQAALKEKDILLGEIHHRVKNNLQVVHSLLDLQSGRIDDETARRLLVESQNRIKSMALIHQTLYESHDFRLVDFRSFLDTLVPVLVSSYSTDPGAVAFEISADEVLLPIDAAIPCGLIVNELISNALKHAFPHGRHGAVRVVLARSGDEEVLLSVADDGVGLPTGVDLENSGTLGLQLVSLLSEQIGAAMAVSRAGPTRFELRFRVAS